MSALGRPPGAIYKEPGPAANPAHPPHDNSDPPAKLTSRAKCSKIKALRVDADDLSNYERQELSKKVSEENDRVRIKKEPTDDRSPSSKQQLKTSATHAGTSNQTRSARTSNAISTSKVLKTIDRATADVPAVKDEKPYVYLEDLEVGIRGEPCPAVCEVKNIEDEDPNISYRGLCNLWRRAYIPWSSAEHVGVGTFSGWKEQNPKDLSLKQLKLLWHFVKHAHIRSASRSIPSELASKPTTGGNTVLITAGTRDEIVQFATILITTEKSRLRSLQDVLCENRRVIEGVPQAVEWEHMRSVICMAHQIPSARVQMKAGSIQFCTAKTMRFASGTSPAKNPDKFFKRPRGSAPALVGGSPFSAARQTVTGAGHVPILDARLKKFNLEDDLLRLDQILEEFEGEVPAGSCVWVGFTSSKYDGANGIGLNFNLMWVVVMGTPADK
ncbi:hypothetical protein HWV62_11936 [Athelia sp. TMB]|nr:hypothetical protein HWV62_11936 [Athelia sp. TMB]